MRTKKIFFPYRPDLLRKVVTLLLLSAQEPVRGLGTTDYNSVIIMMSGILENIPLVIFGCETRGDRF